MNNKINYSNIYLKQSFTPLEQPTHPVSSVEKYSTKSFHQLDNFRKQLTLKGYGFIHQLLDHYTQRVRTYRVIFFGLGLLFFSMGLLIMFKTTATPGHLLGAVYGGSKFVLEGLSFTFGIVAIAVGYKLRPEQEALRELRRRANRQISKTFYNNRGTISRQSYKDCKEMIELRYMETLQLINRIRLSSELTFKERGKLIEQAIGEFQFRSERVIDQLTQ